VKFELVENISELWGRNPVFSKTVWLAQHLYTLQKPTVGEMGSQSGKIATEKLIFHVYALLFDSLGLVIRNFFKSYVFERSLLCSPSAFICPKI